MQNLIIVGYDTVRYKFLERVGVRPVSKRDSGALKLVLQKKAELTKRIKPA